MTSLRSQNDFDVTNLKYQYYFLVLGILCQVINVYLRIVFYSLDWFVSGQWSYPSFRHSPSRPTLDCVVTALCIVPCCISFVLSSLVFRSFTFIHSCLEPYYFRCILSYLVLCHFPSINTCLVPCYFSFILSCIVPGSFNFVHHFLID